MPRRKREAKGEESCSPRPCARDARYRSGGLARCRVRTGRRDVRRLRVEVDAELCAVRGGTAVVDEQVEVRRTTGTRYNGGYLVQLLDRQIVHRQLATAVI